MATEQSNGETTRFESVDGSHAVQVTIPDDRRHISGLIATMEDEP